MLLIHMNAHGFASNMVACLARLDSRAAALNVQARRKAAVVGIQDEGEFVALLRLAAPSAKYNVMSLFVSHHGRWAPTFKRGTPQMIEHLWTIAVAMAAEWEDPEDTGQK